jgi:alpha-glucosidase
MKKYSLGSLIILAVLFSFQSEVEASVFRTKFNSSTSYLIVEVLDDDLVHIETAEGIGPATLQPIYTSPMVFRTDYAGPTAITQSGNVIETPDIRLEINASSLCVMARDKKRSNALLSEVCPVDLGQPMKGINILPGQIQNVYGLGQQFQAASRPTGLGFADGDWTILGTRQGENNLGNGFPGYLGGAVGNVQIPVYYAVGSNNLNYALFLDNVYWQTWNFEKPPWRARMFGDQLRYYIMTGPNLPDLRSDYLELTGKSPVPPRKAFGLWVSEFGYDNWGQIDSLLNGLRSKNFPVDGFVLDLNWFGGITPGRSSGSAMGRLNWDENQEPLVADSRYSFPNPANQIRQYSADNIGLSAIEESYIANSTNTYRDMPPNFLAYRRDSSRKCNLGLQTTPVELNAEDFWGIGRMIDWSDPSAGDWIDQNRRFPNLIRMGINIHWTDLGEPERLDPQACYEGVETTPSGRKIEHSDIHNLYNLLWHQSIWRGYFNRRGQMDNLGRTNPRPLILTRSGAAGIQRFSAAMWSGDIPSNLNALSTHFNTQMHMSFSGIDYYGADIGGFRREKMPPWAAGQPNNTYRGFEEELYTQWFANGAWFDVPVRPHTDNEFISGVPRSETAPHLVGKVDSNLANIQQRYELIPYYYSLAHLIYQKGEPLIAPLVFYYQNDPKVRQIGHEKLIGRDLLVGVVASHGEYNRDMYLPAGRWINYHSNEWINSIGQTVTNLPVYRDGLFRLPVFARAGAIIPQMYVDKNTKDVFGNRQGGVPARNELLVKVYASSQSSTFTLYEDDGDTLNYDGSGRPIYHHRSTELSQQQLSPNSVRVIIGASQNRNGAGAYPGAVTVRQNIVRLIVDNAQATGVTLNGVSLPQQLTQAAFDGAPNGWFNAGKNLILAKSTPLDVSTVKTFNIQIAAVPATTSVNFVCDKGFTNPGESIYVMGNIPAIGMNNPAKAIKLDPNVYYLYIKDGKSIPGTPTNPVWTGVISGLPPNQSFQWQCVRRVESSPSSAISQSKVVIPCQGREEIFLNDWNRKVSKESSSDL